MSHSNIDIQFPKQFKCKQCGSCCLTSGWVYVTLSEANNIAAFLGLDVIEFQNKYLINDRGWWVLSSPVFHPNCFISEIGLCSIYPVRPKTCRTYPMEFNSIAEYKKAITICPELKRAAIRNGQGQLIHRVANNKQKSAQLGKDSCVTVKGYNSE